MLHGQKDHAEQQQRKEMPPQQKREKNVDLYSDFCHEIQRTPQQWSAFKKKVQKMWKYLVKMKAIFISSALTQILLCIVMKPHKALETRSSAALLSGTMLNQTTN